MQTILVIDDDANLLDTISVLVEREGFRAVLASDGLTGLDQAILARPSLIITDLRLPGLSGIEVCKRLRNSGILTPIIVLSAVHEETDKVLLLEIGADDYVVKLSVHANFSREFAPSFAGSRILGRECSPLPTSKSIWIAGWSPAAAKRSGSLPPNTIC